jgi:hypothetical protein
MSHLPIGWLFSAFCVAVLGWVLRGIASPVAKFLKEDRECARRHALDQKKLAAEIEMRERKLIHPAPRKNTTAEEVRRS